MGIFARLATLIKSNINDLISDAEDPEKMLDQIVIDMANQLIEAKKQVAIAIAHEKRLAKQAEAEAAKSAEWKRRAMMAVRAGDDALAQEALGRKREHEGLATAYKDQWAKHKKSVDQIKIALRVLNGKIEEAKRKKQLLKIQNQRAIVNKKIQETLHGLNNASAFEAFERMESKIQQNEAEAEASAELAEEYSGDILKHKFDKLQVTAGAEEDLLALKQEMGLAPKPEPVEEKQVRVDAPAADDLAEFDQLSAAEQDELAAALEELEAEERSEQARVKG